MAVALEIYEALAATPGCTVEHLMAVLRADQLRRDRLRAERAARKAALLGQPAPTSLPKMNNADSVATSLAGSTGQLDTAPAAIGGYHKSVARMAALGSPDLRSGAKLVMAVLIEHHNLKTGRCDPSAARIAEKAGLSARSVRRAVGELEVAGLVRRRVHGGRYHANAYELDWGRLEAVAQGAGIVNKADSDAATRTLVAAEPDSRVHQNESSKQSPSVGVERSARAGRYRFDRSQRELPLVAVVPDTPETADVAQSKAHGRLWSAITKNFSGKALGVVMDAPGFEQIHERAVQSEMNRPGTGIVLLLRELRRETGPPTAASGG